MSQFAIYPRGIKNGTKHYEIRQTPDRLLSTPSRLHISNAEFRRLMNRSADIEVLETGVRIGKEMPVTPSIKLRVPRHRTDDCVDTVFISPQQLEELAIYFKTPAEVLNQAFFALSPDCGPSDPTFHVKPVWSELLNPEWKTAYLAWLEGKGRAPTPSEINWRSFGEGRISMPGLSPLLYFSESRDRLIKGKLLFNEIEGMKLATFRYKKAYQTRELHYHLGLNNVELMRHKNQPGSKINGAPPWNASNFRKLFGQKPSVSEYIFYKDARKIGMSLGNIGGNHFIISSSARRFGFAEDRTYVIACRRIDNSLIVEVRANDDVSRTIARGVMELDSVVFLPQRTAITLDEV